MNIVPFELKHLDMIDMSKTNHVSINVTAINKEYIIYGKTAFDEDEVIGIGVVSLTGMIAIAFLMITDRIRESPLFFIKSIKNGLLEVVNEGYTIISAVHTETEKRFMEYLGFEETGLFENNGIKLTRYRYGSSSIS